ncbi:MAG TPA: LEA type 2 family protein [Byssovorax sp.]
MSRTTQLALLPGLALLALAAAGCVERPIVHVDHAEVRSASIQGVAMGVVLRIQNPNAYDVQVRRVHATVTINGHLTMPPVDIAPNQWLPSGKTSYVYVPAFIPWGYVPGLIAESTGSPIIRYHVSGTADVTATRTLGVDADDYPIDEDGLIPREVFVGAARSVMPF